MKTYYLKTKNGETINKTKQNSIELAIVFFSNMKLLKVIDLLNIYKITN